MKSTFHVPMLAGLFFASLLVLSCQKENGKQSTAINDEEAQTISTENAVADAEDDDVTEIGLSAGADLEAVVEAGRGAGPGTNLGARLELFADLKFKIGPCTKITVTPNDSTFPKTITIDYGDGCICFDGKFRKGSITLTYTAPLRQPGASLTITLNGFYVNRVHIEGTRIVTNLSTGGVRKYSVQVKGGKITWPNGRGFAYAGLKVVTQVRGSDTRTIRDDVYSIEGRSELSYNNGLTITRNTETPLIKPVACAWIVQGVLKITINNHVFYIDFGTGTCDNKAILKGRANGEVTITLP